MFTLSAASYARKLAVVRFEAVKKWGQAPREHAKSSENTTMARSQSPFFHSLFVKDQRFEMIYRLTNVLAPQRNA